MIADRVITMKLLENRYPIIPMASLIINSDKKNTEKMEIWWMKRDLFFIRCPIKAQTPAPITILITAAIPLSRSCGAYTF